MRPRPSGANSRTTPLALERARSQSPPPTSTHTMVALTAASLVAARVRSRANRPARGAGCAARRNARGAHCVASARPADRSRGASRLARLALDPAAAAQLAVASNLAPPARRARTRAAAPSGSSRCSCPSRASSRSRRGRGARPGTTTRTRLRRAGRRIPKTTRKTSPSRVAKTASAETRPSPRTCEERRGFFFVTRVARETNGTANRRRIGGRRDVDSRRRRRGGRAPPKKKQPL